MGQILRLDRQALKNSGKRYAAGKTSRSTGDWIPLDTAVNDLIAMSGPGVRARIRQLIRDFPYFARAKETITTFVVGSGLELQSRAHDTRGRFNPELSRQIEDGYRSFCDEADISGALHLKEMEALCRDQQTECGEYFLIKTRSGNTKRYIPLALQMFEPDWLDTAARAKYKNSTVEQGVELDVSTGERLGYHFTDPDGWGKSTFIPADRVIHGFKTLRPGQVRGISDFTPGVIVTRDLQDCMEGEIDGFKFASKWLAFVKRNGMPGGSGDSQGRVIEELENGIIEYL